MTVAEFVREVECEFASYTDGETRNAVRLTTYHLAKGLPEPGIFLIAVTDQPGGEADTLVVEAFRRSERGQFLQDDADEADDLN